ncbi:MAG: ABC transporter substrate-binding protein, partial [Actinobacteria bacterium]|nr:ABC transporter substrate-binding protein [Actinomycetota bacterium]
MRSAGRAAALVAVITTATALAACSSSNSGSGSSPASKPVFGGTLRVIAASGPDELDPVAAYNFTSYGLERGYARQLLSYPTTSPTATSGPVWTKGTTVVADAATQVPSASNGGISNGGLTYTYHIRKGVDWNSTPPRQVTAADFIREFKAFCNPSSPNPAPAYFTSTIKGFASYCNGETSHFSGKHAPSPTPASVAAWQNSHTISGLSAPNPLTLQVTLAQPASDFNNIMALPFVSARPAEYDKYLPNSAQLNQHMMSDGPYQLSAVTPGKSWTLTRNPAWKQSTDPLRHQYVKEITETTGGASQQTVLTDLQGGSQDLAAADTGIPSQSIASLLSSHDKRLKIFPGGNDFPYLVFNLRSPNNGHAVGKLALRQAVEYGVNKAEVVKIGGGPALNTITNTAIPPGSAGYQPSSLYKTPGNQGETAKCKSLLASAGYPHGVKLNVLYATGSSATTLFQALQGNLKACGIQLTSKPDANFFTDVSNTAQTNKPGTFDMAITDWFPDWYGSDNGRTTVQPLFQTNCSVGTVNVGCYSNPAVDNMIKRALSASSTKAADALWQQADTTIMKDAAIVPLTSSKVA